MNPVHRARCALPTAALTAAALWPQLAMAQDVAPDSPWSLGLVASMLALGIGALAAVLGMWVTRDSDRPIAFALAMTALIFAAVGVGIVQSYLDSVKAMQKRADLARMMGTIKQIAIATGDTELAALIEAQSGEKVELPPPPEPEPAADEAGAEGDAADGEEGEEGEEAADDAAGDEATGTEGGE